jgi:hypothetical protein
MKKFSTLLLGLLTVWSFSNAQNVGVDVATPQQKLDVAGGIKIGNTSNGVAGSLRWNGTSLQIYDGSAWVTLGSNTDDQQFDVIQLTGTNLELSLEDDGVGTYTVDLSSLADNTDDQVIDLIQLVGNSLQLSLEGDGQAPQSVDLSSLANTDDQTIDVMTINSNQLTLSLENDGQAPLTVDLSAYLDNTDDQQIDLLTLSGNNLQLSLEADGQAPVVLDLSQFMDNTDNQTIDVAQLSGTDLLLSLEDDGQANVSVDLSSLANTDDQTIDVYNITGNQLTLSLENDGQSPLTVDLSPYLDNTDNQQLDVLQLNGNNLEVSLQNDGQAPQTVDLSVFADNTDDQTFDVIQLTGNTLELSLENDGQATHSIDLSAYADNTDDQTIDAFNLSGNTLNLSIEDDGAPTQQVDLGPLKRRLEDADTDTRVEVEANPDEDRIRFTTATAQRMVIMNDGKVGIGSTAPDNQLTVAGSPSTAFPALGINSGNNQTTFNNGAQIAFGYNNTDEYQHFIHTRHNQLASANNAIDFYVHSGGVQNNSVTSGSTHVMSLNAGNVGIGGVTSPAQRLHVSGNARITSLSGGSNRLVMTDNAGDLYATTDVPGGDASYIWNGTASQSANFHITGQGDVGTELYVGNWIRKTDDDGILWQNRGWYMYPSSNADMQMRSGDGTSGSFRFMTGTSTRAYLHWTEDWTGWLNSGRQWQLRTRNDDGYSPSLYFDEEGNESWTGNPGNDEGKIEYHSNRFYIASGANSAEIVRFRRSGSDVARINNDGSVWAPIMYDINNSSYYVNPNDWSRMYEAGINRVYAYWDVRSPRYYDYNDTYWFVDPRDQTRMNGTTELARNSGYTYIANAQSWGYCNSCQSSAFGCCNSDWWGCVSYCTGTSCGVCGRTVYAKMNVNGGMYSYAYWTSSDYKYKSDVATIGNALSYINQVRGVSYKLIDPEEETSNYDPNKDSDRDYLGPQIGFIAQELQEVLPQLVHEEEIVKDPETGEKETKIGVAYGQMTALLVEGMKEQQKMIEELQREIASLKSGGINPEDVRVGDQQEILDVIEMIESNMDTFEEKHKAEIQEFVESIRNVKYLTTEHRIAITKIKNRLGK